MEARNRQPENDTANHAQPPALNIPPPFQNATSQRHRQRIFQEDSSHSPSPNHNARPIRRQPIKRIPRNHQNHQPTRSTRRAPRRAKDPNEPAPMGRPPNHKAEPQHLAESRAYNSIVYHFCKMLLLLKLRQGRHQQAARLSLSNEGSRWMEKVADIMGMDNFPQYGDKECPVFLLHPNSIHFVLRWLLEREERKEYSSQEMGLMVKALLLRRDMLTVESAEYLDQYWEDIVELVRSPNGKSHSVEVGPEDQDYVIEGEREEREGEMREEEGQEEQVRGGSELQWLRRELQLDESVAAYQIACYLHACCVKFGIVIV